MFRHEMPEETFFLLFCGQEKSALDQLFNAFIEIFVNDVFPLVTLAQSVETHTSSLASWGGWEKERRREHC